jgi:hypothetical protein
MQILESFLKTQKRIFNDNLFLNGLIWPDECFAFSKAYLRFTSRLLFLVDWCQISSFVSERLPQFFLPI